jgi:hypothetical protein
MNRDATTPIPFLSEAEAAPTRDRLARLSDSLGAGEGRIDTSGSVPAADARVAPATALRRELVGAQAVAILIARLRAEAEGSLSRPVPLAELPQEAGNACAHGNAKADSEPPVADFLEPVQYNWTGTGYEVRQALKKFSEQTHANH